MGYTAELAVWDDHLMVGQRVHQASNDNGSLEAMAEAVEEVNGERPGAVMADAGYDSMGQIQAVEQRGIEV